jgi:hypothetical protein
MLSSHIYMFCFSRLVHVPHIYKYSIGPTTRSVEYHLFRQFLKFTEWLRQFLPDMFDLWTGHVRLWARTCPGIGFPVYIRGLSAPLES